MAPLWLSAEIPERQPECTLTEALQALRLITQEQASTRCGAVFASVQEPQRLRPLSRWYALWLQLDPGSAWAWLQGRLGESARRQDWAAALADAVGDLGWATAAARIGRVEVLVHVLEGVYALSTPAEEVTADSGQTSIPGQPSTLRPRERHSELDFVPARIVNWLVERADAAAFGALERLTALARDEGARRWLAKAQSALLDQMVELAAIRPPGGLNDMLDCRSESLRSEAALFRQTLLLRESIRSGLEDGPFSERGLFLASMPEKTLQLWLASRLAGVNPRGYTVHREEELDDDKKPDVQLSTVHGSVCVEIKPLDASRSYSATSLVDTLRDQLVGQYLKGANSGHGILLIIQLDAKQWAVPGVDALVSCSQLVAYLQKEALHILRSDSNLGDLRVFGFDCSAPSGSAAAKLPKPRKRRASSNGPMAREPANAIDTVEAVEHPDAVAGSKSPSATKPPKARPTSPWHRMQSRRKRQATATLRP